MDIKDLINDYRKDVRLKQYSNKHYPNSHSIYRGINTKEDIEEIKQGVEYVLELYSNIYPLSIEDISEIEKELAKYEIAIRKVLSLYGRIKDFDYNTKELQKLIDDRFRYEEELKEIQLRLLSQDY